MNDITLIVQRTFNAPIEDVFDAWTDPQRVAEWYGPEGITATVHSLDLRVGGTYSLTMISDTGEKYPLQGEFRVVEKPTKLVMTWQWVEAHGMVTSTNATLVTVELKEVGGKTEMTMTHSGFDSEEGKQHHNEGWSSSFKKLEVMLREE
jgi:uncharacterized protein YndB with AHSA1/START domain